MKKLINWLRNISKKNQTAALNERLDAVSSAQERNRGVVPLSNKPKKRKSPAIPAKRGKTSKYRGVYFSQQTGKYRAEFNGKSLGSFARAKDAAIERDYAVMRDSPNNRHILNFPEIVKTTSRFPHVYYSRTDGYFHIKVCLKGEKPVYLGRRKVELEAGRIAKAWLKERTYDQYGKPIIGMAAGSQAMAPIEEANFI